MDFISAIDLAKEVGCSGSYIRKQIEEGKLTGERIGKRTLIVLRDEKLVAWLANPRRKSHIKSQE